MAATWRSEFPLSHMWSIRVGSLSRIQSTALQREVGGRERRKMRGRGKEGVEDEREGGRREGVEERKEREREGGGGGGGGGKGSGGRREREGGREREILKIVLIWMTETSCWDLRCEAYFGGFYC